MNRLILLALMLTCCGPLPLVDAPAGINYSLSCPCLPKRGVSSGLAYMPDLAWPQPTVAVCFENGTPAQQAWIEDAVTRTWGRASRLQLTGWGACGAPEAPAQGVRVHLSDHFDVRGLGVQLNQYQEGLTIGSPNGTERDLRTLAVYGFGFVLGFTAEQDRGDAPCQTYNRFPGYSQKVLGPWDDLSVMNDCRPGYNGGMLSEGDIAGVQQVYGEPTTCDCE